MRLFLLPVSTRRSLIYCEKLHEKAAGDRGYLDKLTTKASTTWLAWEQDAKAPFNWKKRVTQAGNKALNRIPFEEWGLKTIPALTPKRKSALADGREKCTVVFPPAYLKDGQVPAVLHRLATEKRAMYSRKLLWSIVAMPFTIPFALVPIIPNLPFFYLLYRAYSYWTALTGSKNLAWLLTHSLPTRAPSSTLDALYTAGLMHPSRTVSRAAAPPSPAQQDHVARVLDTQTRGGKEDAMVLQRWNGKLIAEHFALPDMEVEIERAVEQVEGAIKEREKLASEKAELESVVGKAPVRAGEKAESGVAEKKEDRS